MTEVQLISAPWCKRCVVIKPDVASCAAMNGATLTVVDYEEMEESEKADIKSLPTIRLRLGSTEAWTVFTADTLDLFKTTLRVKVPADLVAIICHCIVKIISSFRKGIG